jgi:Coenzyme PQQ synthesis protein D (PqqD)
MVQVSEHVRKIHSLDGGIVLDILHGQMFGLNFVGSRILELLQQQSTPTLIAQEIAATFGISAETAERDVREFLETLEKHHLIEPRATRTSL